MPIKKGSINIDWGRHLSNGTLLGDGLDVVAGFGKSLSMAFGGNKDKSQDTIYQIPPIDILEQDVTLNVTTRASAIRAAKLMLVRLSPLPEVQIEWDIVGPHGSTDGKSQYTLGIVRKADLENWDGLQAEHNTLRSKGRNGGAYQFTSTLSRQTKRKQTLLGLLVFAACYLGLLWGLGQWNNRPVRIADSWQAQARETRLTTHDIRAEMENSQLRSALISGYRSNMGSAYMLDVLASMSKTMPDNGWIREVNLSKGQIRVSGTTDNPAKLAAQIEAKPFIERVQLGAVSSDRSSGLQRFTLTMILAVPTP